MGKDINDLTGALACAIVYHVYPYLKFGKMPEIAEAIETSIFGYVRAYAFSSAKAFSNDSTLSQTGSFSIAAKWIFRGTLSILASSPIVLSRLFLTFTHTATLAMTF